MTVRPTDDGIIIEGKGKSGEWGAAIFTGGEIESHHDHRIAMSFSMAGLRTSGADQDYRYGNSSNEFPDLYRTDESMQVCLFKFHE